MSKKTRVCIYLTDIEMLDITKTISTQGNLGYQLKEYVIAKTRGEEYDREKSTSKSKS